MNSFYLFLSIKQDPINNVKPHMLTYNKSHFLSFDEHVNANPDKEAFQIL